MKVADLYWPKRLIIILLFSMGVIFHFLGGDSLADATGIPLVFDHIFQLAVVMGLLWIAASVGIEVLSRSRVTFPGPVAELSYGTVVGCILLAIALLVLGSVSLLSPLPVALLLLMALLLSRHSMFQVPALIGKVLSWIVNHASQGACRLLFLAVVILTLTFLLLSGLTPATDWDSLMYHLQIPKQFIQHQRIFVPEDNLHVSYIGLIHMLYIPALLLQANAAPALINALLSMMLALAVVEASLELFDERTAWLSLPFFWANTILLLVGSTARIDVSHTLLLFLGHLATMQALLNLDQKRWFLLGGFLLGSSVGVKLSGLAYAFGLLPLLAYYLIKQLRNREAWLNTSAWLIAFTLGAIPWLAKNYFLLGAPLYPYFANRLVDPWLIPILGGRVISEDAIGLFQNLLMARSKFNPIAAFISPSSISIETEGVFYFLNPFLMMIPMVLIILKDRKRVMLLLPPALYILGIYVLKPTSNLRYYIPVLPALTVLLANLLVKLGPQRPSVSSCRWLLLAFAVISLIPTSAMIVWQMCTNHTTAFTLGSISMNDYLSQYPDDGFVEYMQVVDFIQDSLPEDSEILMLFDGRGFYINQSTIQDNMITNWPLLAPRISSGQELLAMGISHIFVNTGTLHYYVQRGTDIDAVAWDAFLGFAETELHQVYESPTYSLYEIDGEK